MERIYLDHAATTQILPEVQGKMSIVLSNCCGNPSSLHSAGRAAREIVEESRANVAKLIGAKDPHDIIFTSGGSESDNLALQGLAPSLAAKGKPVILVSDIEHHAILRQRPALERYGVEMQTIPVDKYGGIRFDVLEEELKTGDVGLVSIMLVNNETGVIQDMKEIAKLCHQYGALLHTDAVQAVGHIPVDVRDIGVDLMSLSGHKFGAPIGVGALYANAFVRRQFLPIIYGGEQENGFRSGTENVPGVAALGEAARIMTESLDYFIYRYMILRITFLNTLESFGLKDFQINQGIRQFNGILSLTISRVEAEALLHMMDADGVCLSAASACSAGSLKPSHVLTAIGLDADEASSTVRVSFGWNNTQEQVRTAAKLLCDNVRAIRKMY